MRPYKVVILAGPTAVGKTAVLQEAQQYFCQQRSSWDGPSVGGGIEVLNCDSIQVYRHLDIASAKPSIALQKQLPHHLLGILDPREEFTAGYFVRSCDALVPQITGRKGFPVLAGGTVFYLKSFLYGLAEIPKLQGHFRMGLQELETELLSRRLAELDPYSKIHSHDRQRLLRACEVCLETGRPFSSYRRVERLRPQYRTLCIVLQRPRKELYRRIDRRVEEMFAAGLPEEVKQLRQMGYGPGDPGLKGIGYREFFTVDGKMALQKIQQHSRNYAKRQLVFLRQLPGAEYFAAEEAVAISRRMWQFFCS